MNFFVTTFGGLHPLVDAPLWVVLLLKTTVILSAAWVAHLAFTRFNPRWRVFLWRATAIASSFCRLPLGFFRRWKSTYSGPRRLQWRP